MCTTPRHELERHWIICNRYIERVLFISFQYHEEGVCNYASSNSVNTIPVEIIINESKKV